MKVFILVCLGTMLVLSACNTVGGIGRDLQSVGNSVSKVGK